MAEAEKVVCHLESQRIFSEASLCRLESQNSTFRKIYWYGCREQVTGLSIL
jgi:hypothetical protein